MVNVIIAATVSPPQPPQHNVVTLAHILHHHSLGVFRDFTGTEAEQQDFVEKRTRGEM